MDKEKQELLDGIKKAARLFYWMSDGDIQIIKESERHWRIFEELARKYDEAFQADGEE